MFQPAFLFLALVLNGPVSNPDNEGEPRLSELTGTTLLTTSGERTSLPKLAEGEALVIAYTGVGCPISGKYAARLGRLAARYAPRGVHFVGVNANPQDTREAVATECRELELGIEVLKDHRQQLTRALEARTTTEVFVFDAGGALAYRGAVDDQYSLGAAKPEPTVHWLVDALEATLAGETPAVEETEAPGCLLTILPEDELPAELTYASDIAPILRKNCEVCHRPGQVGPFSLQTYEKARGWGEMIADVVREDRMPPWNATEDYRGVFANERRLREKDKQKILQWVEGGMLRGNPEDEPPPASWPEGWTIGEPDAVFSMGEAMLEETAADLTEAGYRVPREGTVEYQYFVTETDFPEDRWIQAMEVRPGAADVVHHVLVLLHDPAEGPLNLNRTEDFLTYLAVAAPGDLPTTFPEGYGKKLPAGSTLIFQLHYTPNGKERFDRSSMAMIFADEPPVFEVATHAVVNDRFRIPPGAGNHEVTAFQVLEEDTGVISFFPHMHTRGKDIKYVARYPDGTVEELLYSDYDFNWQESYVYHDPKLLPSGTRLELIGHFDNSHENPNNPDPDAEVEWGDQTWEEMFIGYYDHVVPLDE